MIGVPVASVVWAAPMAVAQAATVEDRLSSQVETVRRAALAEVLARPETVNPFAYALVATLLLRDGRQLQAAFWFYLMQIRTRPWADADKGGDGAAALRASFNQVLGEPINGWLGADLAQWQEVARRAMSYETRLPLFAGRPDGLSAADWQARVAAARADYRKGYDQTLAVADAAAIAKSRRENGLPVGALADPGPPLPDDWR